MSTATISEQDQNMLKGEYDLDFLINRAYRSFNLDRGKIKLVTPIFEKKDRKSYIHNFQEVCKSINRSPDEIRVYIGKEVNKETSIKEDGSLKIDGMPKSAGVIEGCIKNYVINYVMCKACKSCKTKIQKIDRITYLICDACKSQRAFGKDKNIPKCT